MQTTASARRPRVVIVGAGFGGINAAQALGNKDVDVLVLSRTDYHGFWMLLYQVAGGQLDPATIARPAAAMLRRYRNTRFQVAEVREVNLERRQVVTEAETIPYDYLILAAGSATHYFGNERYRAHTLGLHDVGEAERLRDRVTAAFAQASREPDPRRRAALMTVVLVGGGPTGVELAGAFAELIRGPLASEHPSLDMREARVVLVEASDAILGSFPASLQRSARRKLASLGVELRVAAAVTDINGERLALADGAELEAQTIVWAAGVRAAPLADTLGVALGRSARVPVAPDLSLPGHPEVSVVGDMAYLERSAGAAYPMVAQVAIQMGKLAGRNILAQIAGRAPRPFSYFDFGQMAMVGRGAALFDSAGILLDGVLGWLIWLSVHLAYLPGLRNRLAALASWAATAATGQTTLGAPRVTSAGPRSSS